ncbi:MAG: hypothetical protein FWG07_01060 [Treponema sp.]|nr:hypothetical protein [Treponema sp.]
MTNSLNRTAEEWFGIKADPGDVKKLQEYINKTYGGITPDILNKVFSSGEATDFLTVNETYFFREPAHFAFLYDLLPSFEKTGIEICSAAVSAGCEAYSIAMLIESYNKSAARPLAYHIDAFDIDPNIIETACRGVYNSRSLREDGSCFRYMTEPYLEKLEDGYQIKGILKKNIRFFVHNLMDKFPPKEYDIIFFRNAFIYFTSRHRSRVLSNLSAVLKADGILFLGVSETAGVYHDGLEGKNRNEVFYFQKSVSGREPHELSFPTPDFTCSAEKPEKDTSDHALSAKNRGQTALETDFTAEESQKTVKPRKQRQKELCFDISTVGNILSCDEKSTELTGQIQRILQDNSFPEGLDGNELVVSVLHLLKKGNFSGAGAVLDYLEILDDSSMTAFLRGEYFFYQDLFTEAELYYRISLIKNDVFWPAGYRLSSLSSVGVLKKYRVEKALEGLHRGRDLQYEVFIGGFSPDYYISVLLKQKAG